MIKINNSSDKMVITVISGKGGTGKTSLVSSLSKLIDQEFVKADCDVDASNLGIILKGETRDTFDYSGAKVAKINQKKCVACGACVRVCRYNAISFDILSYKVDPMKCEGCNACVIQCKLDAISLNQEKTAEISINKTNYGDFVSSSMLPGAEGSGKLVSEVRKVSESINNKMILDGSPGVGCSVMASVTGTDYSIIVTEPTQSGLEDLKRVYEITKHFNSKALCVINKYDINLEISQSIENYCEKNNITVLGKVPLDPVVSRAINNLKCIVDYPETKAAKAVIKIYKRLLKILKEEV